MSSYSKHFNKLLKYSRKQSFLDSERRKIYKMDNYIIKVFDTKKPNYRNEYNQQIKLKHKNILPIIDSYYEKTNFNIVYPFCKKGDVFNNIINKTLSEEDIINIFKKLVNPVKYLHRKNIVHLDLKLENYLVNNNDYVLIDFENARYYNDDYYNLTNIDKICGTFKYIAPEVKEYKYGPTSDIYSIGSVIYLICARMHHNRDEIDWNIIQKHYTLLYPLLKDMLQPQHTLRPSIFHVSKFINKL